MDFFPFNCWLTRYLPAPQTCFEGRIWASVLQIHRSISHGLLNTRSQLLTFQVSTKTYGPHTYQSLTLGCTLSCIQHDLPVHLFIWLFGYCTSPQHNVFKPVTLQTKALSGSFTPAGFRFAHPQASKSQIEMSSSNFTFWELSESVCIFAVLLHQAYFGSLPAFLA